VVKAKNIGPLISKLSIKIDEVSNTKIAIDFEEPIVKFQRLKLMDLFVLTSITHIPD
jgi:hypothetical protein